MTNPNLPPSTLYRGVTMPASQFSEALIDTSLVSGPQTPTEEAGVRPDGNEAGVYMTDNPHMADVSYATPGYGDDIPDSPTFSTRHQSHARVQTPRVGALYEINTTGLSVRPPRISSVMEGVRNNGFQGNEWLADEVPAENHRLTRLRVGPDLLHGPEVVDVGNNRNEAFETVQAILAQRAGSLALLGERLSSLPPDQRHNQYAVNPILAEMAAKVAQG